MTIVFNRVEKGLEHVMVLEFEIDMRFLTSLLFQCRDLSRVLQSQHFLLALRLPPFSFHFKSIGFASRPFGGFHFGLSLFFFLDLSVQLLLGKREFEISLTFLALQTCSSSG